MDTNLPGDNAIDMDEKLKLEEHMTDWVMGKLSPEEKAHLEQQIALDPALAQMARETEIAMEVIKAAQQQKLRERLIELDHQQKKPGSKNIHWLIVLFIFFLVGCACLFILSLFRQPQYLATKHLIALPEFCVTASESHQREWAYAAASFKTKDFETAIRSYAILAVDDNREIHYTARWNLLMAQLAKEGATPGWRLALNNFRNEAPEPFRTKASLLDKKLGTWVFNLLSLPIRDPFHVIKPRLI